MTRPATRDAIYRGRVFDAEFIELCVRWYITYRLSYRDLVAMMAERGIAARAESARLGGSTKRTSAYVASGTISIAPCISRG